MNKIIFIIALLFGVVACGSTETENPATQKPGIIAEAPTPTAKPAPLIQPVPAEGTWTFTEDDFISEVIIRNGEVTVNMGVASGNLIYWKGTFDQTQLLPGDRIVSNGDTAYLENTLAGSSKKTMTFRYKSNSLTYDMTFQGVTKTLVAKK